MVDIKKKDRAASYRIHRGVSGCIDQWKARWNKCDECQEDFLKKMFHMIQLQSQFFFNTPRIQCSAVIVL